jgi:TP901 family phage tail tape measure protein
LAGSEVAKAYVTLRAELDKLKRDLTQGKTVVAKGVAEMEKVGVVGRGAASGGGFNLFAGGGLKSTLAFLGAGAAVVSLGRQVGTFEDTMVSVRANFRLLGERGEADFLKLRDAAREMGKTTRFTAAQAAAALDELGLGGLSVQQAIGALPNVMEMAAATGMGLSDSATVLVDNMQKFGMAASETSKITDYLISAQTRAQTKAYQIAEAHLAAGSAMSQLGISFRDSTALITTMAKGGERGVQAGTALRVGLSRLINPTAEVNDALRAIGVSMEDFIDPATGNITDVIGLMNALAGSSMGAKEAIQLFGQRGVRMLSLFGVMRKTTTAGGGNFLTETAAGLSADVGMGALVAAKKMETASSSIKEFWSAISELAIQVGDILLPPLTKIVERLTEMVQWVAEVNDKTGGWIGKIASAAAVLGVLALKFRAFSGISKILGGLSIKTKLILIAFDALLPLIIKASKWLSRVFQESGLANIMAAAVERIGEGFRQVALFAGQLRDVIKESLGPVFEWLGKVGKWVLKRIEIAINNLAFVLADPINALKMLWNRVQYFGASILDYFVKLWADIAATAASLGAQIWQIMKNAFDKVLALLEGVKHKFLAIFEGIGAGIEAIFNLENPWEAAREAFEKEWTRGGSGPGLMDGVKEAGEEAAEATRDALGYDSMEGTLDDLQKRYAELHRRQMAAWEKFKRKKEEGGEFAGPEAEVGFEGEPGEGGGEPKESRGVSFLGPLEMWRQIQQDMAKKDEEAIQKQQLNVQQQLLGVAEHELELTRQLAEPGRRAETPTSAFEGSP